MSTVINDNIQLWRQKCRDNTMTLEEYQVAIAAIRKERIGASSISAKSTANKATAAAKKQPIDSDDLLSQLGGI